MMHDIYGASVVIEDDGRRVRPHSRCFRCSESLVLRSLSLSVAANSFCRSSSCCASSVVLASAPIELDFRVDCVNCTREIKLHGQLTENVH